MRDPASSRKRMSTEGVYVVESLDVGNHWLARLLLSTDIQRAPNILSFIITTLLLIVNVEICQKFGDLSNLSSGVTGSEQIFVTQAGVQGSGIKESITTVTPLSYSPTLRKKLGSSDLQADVFSDELPVVKLSSRFRHTRLGGSYHEPR